MNESTNLQAEAVVSFLKRRWYRIALALMVVVLLWQQFCWNKHVPVTQGVFTEAAAAKGQPATTAATEPTSKAAPVKPKTPTPPKPQEVPLSIGSAADNIFTKRKPVSEFPKPDAVSVQQYLQQYRATATQEAQKYKIPVAIILANAIRQSFSGRRDIALSGNNHFGLPCTSGWTGKSVHSNSRCYRAYESVWASYRDHSLFLKQDAFKSLFKTSDISSWARGLEQAGYPEMNAQELLEIITTYNIK